VVGGQESPAIVHRFAVAFQQAVVAVPDAVRAALRGRDDPLATYVVHTLWHRVVAPGQEPPTRHAWRLAYVTLFGRQTPAPLDPSAYPALVAPRVVPVGLGVGSGANSAGDGV
jgi:hypothetical protein